MSAPEAVCLQLLRRRAYPLYLSALFAPAAKRGALAALYALQTEILAIGESVSEPLLGAMRLQWWRENIESCFKNRLQATELKTKNDGNEAARLSPILAALAAAAETYALPPALLQRLCEAAHFDIGAEAMPDCAALAAYCDGLYGGILQTAGKILAAEYGGAAEEACRAGGMAQGLAMIIRHLPRSLRQGKFYIPADMLLSAGADRQSLGYGLSPQQDALFVDSMAKRRRLSAALLAYFHEHYRVFAAAQRRLPARLRPAFLPLAVLPAVIKRAEKQPETIFTAPPLRLSPLAEQLRISRAAIFNRF